jgi:hypothetical protein
MAYRGSFPPPKKSLGIFEGLGGLLDARQERQQTLEDRLAQKQQRESSAKSRTIEDALNQARLDAMSRPQAPKIIGRETDPVTGEVVVIRDDGSAEPVKMAGGRAAPPMGHDADDAMHGYGEPQQAPPPATLKMGVKPKDEPLETVMRDGRRVLVPRSQAAGMEAPSPAGPDGDRTLVPVQQEDGTIVYVSRSQAAGKRVPGPNNTGAATISKAVAANKTQLSVIDDALKELDSHPGAVGLMRGLPIVGDRLDPRMDPKGVAARAQIANIGSLKIHDRSGAAVSIHEFPRLAPFIPLLSDPPAAIRTKLKKLREAIDFETGLLSQGAVKPTGGSSPSGDPQFDALMAKYAKKP